MIDEAPYMASRGVGAPWDRHELSHAYLCCWPLRICRRASPRKPARPRAVIELFTSQGCSSCPPADKLLGELAKDPTLVTLSLPVDYWDYLGWKDTLALHGHTNRQRAYSSARGDRNVYTPQAVINGVVHVLGSDKAAIEKAIAQTRQSATPLAVPVTLKIADEKIDRHGGGRQRQQRRQRRSLALPDHRHGAGRVGRGENSGRTLTYHNVVRRWVKLGDWNGKAETFSLPLSELAGKSYALGDIDRVAVVLQSGVAAKPG